MPASQSVDLHTKIWALLEENESGARDLFNRLLPCLTLNACMGWQFTSRSCGAVSSLRPPAAFRRVPDIRTCRSSRPFGRMWRRSC